MSKEFSADKPIYIQILDYCMDCISTGAWAPLGRIPSVKELSVAMAVNPRTVMRAYEELSESSIIFQRRGMGFYVDEDAAQRVAAIRRAEFERTVLPDFLERLRCAAYPVESVIEALERMRRECSARK